MIDQHIMDPSPRISKADSASDTATQELDQPDSHTGSSPSKTLSKEGQLHSHTLLHLADARDRSAKGEHVVGGVTDDPVRGGKISRPLQRKFSSTAGSKGGYFGTKTSYTNEDDGREGSRRMDYQNSAENGATALAPSPLNPNLPKEPRTSGEIENKRMSFSSLLSLGSMYGNVPGPGSQTSSVAGSIKASAMEPPGGQKEHKSPALISPHMDVPITPTTAIDNVSALSSAHSSPPGLSLYQPFFV